MLFRSDLRNYRAFEEALKVFEAFAQTAAAKTHDNFRTHTWIYINIAKINRHLMHGTFREGVALVPKIENNLSTYALFIDRHRILVFNYKFASLFFGNGDYSKAVDYLLKILNGPMDLRADLQCYARLMHLMCHYEMENYDLLESLIKSAYRFMARMKNLTQVEEEVFRFLRSSFGIAPKALREELQKLLAQIKHLEKNRHETRSFAYLDLISWIESKVDNKSMGEVIQKKYALQKMARRKL